MAKHKRPNASFRLDGEGKERKQWKESGGKKILPKCYKDAFFKNMFPPTVLACHHLWLQNHELVCKSPICNSLKINAGNSLKINTGTLLSHPQ